MSKVVRLGGRKHWVWRFYDEDRLHDDHSHEAWAVVGWNDGQAADKSCNLMACSTISLWDQESKANDDEINDDDCITIF